MLTAAGGAAVPALALAFGAEFITPEGALDYARMRALVFAATAQGKAAKAQLEKILHPQIFAICVARMEDCRASAVVLESPLLVLTPHWHKLLDGIWVVDCAPETQVARVQARSNLTAKEVQNIMRTQGSREARLALADWVIVNENLTPQALTALVQARLKTELAAREKAALK
jgi:dephospho-CoA kinase